MEIRYNYGNQVTCSNPLLTIASRNRNNLHTHGKLSFSSAALLLIPVKMAAVGDFDNLTYTVNVRSSSLKFHQSRVHCSDINKAFHLFYITNRSSAIFKPSAYRSVHIGHVQ